MSFAVSIVILFFVWNIVALISTSLENNNKYEKLFSFLTYGIFAVILGLVIYILVHFILLA